MSRLVHCTTYPRSRLHLLVAALALTTSQIVFADHPRPDQMQTVQQLADQLDRTASSAASEARRYQHHGGSSEQHAIEAMNSLESSARHFHRSVEQNFSNPAHTESDFLRLNRDFGVAMNEFHDLTAYSQVRYLFDRLVSEMNQLRVYYTGGSAGVWNPAEVRRLAHETEKSAQHLHRRAEGESHHGGYAEKAAVSDLHKVNDLARHFHKAVENAYSDPVHSANDLLRLISGVERARQSLAMTHGFSHHVYDDFEALSQRVQRLRYYYGV